MNSYFFFDVLLGFKNSLLYKYITRSGLITPTPVNQSETILPDPVILSQGLTEKKEQGNPDVDLRQLSAHKPSRAVPTHPLQT